VHGAPKLGDKTAWRPRLSEGVEKLYQTTINGMGEMPARGACGDCTDGDLMSLVDSMIDGAK
jgi:cytochrome c5